MSFVAIKYGSDDGAEEHSTVLEVKREAENYELMLRSSAKSDDLDFLQHICMPIAAGLQADGQFILIMLASSIVSTVSVPELTATANDVQGLTFRSLEAYLVVAAIYVALTGIFKSVFAALGHASFGYRRAAR